MPTLSPRQQIASGKYELLSPLGKGGQASVWKAKQHGIGSFSKQIALKILHTTQSKLGHEQQEQFLHEARLAAQLQHPNLVQIFDVGAEQSLSFIAMEYINGHTLRKILQEKKAQQTTELGLPWFIAVKVISYLSKGLAHAHKQTDDKGQPLQLIHRDLKPENVLLGQNGEVKLIDFGTAKATNNPVQTEKGLVKGTPSYMAPEQIRAKKLGPQADQFSLGCVLYELCTGQSPFQRRDVQSTLYAILEEKPKPLHESSRSIPKELQSIIDKLLSKEPSKRFSDTSQLSPILENLLREKQYFIEQEELAAFYQKHFSAKKRKQASPNQMTQSFIVPNDESFSKEQPYTKAGKGQVKLQPSPDKTQSLQGGTALAKAQRTAPNPHSTQLYSNENTDLDKTIQEQIDPSVMAEQLAQYAPKQALQVTSSFQAIIKPEEEKTLIFSSSDLDISSQQTKDSTSNPNLSYFRSFLIVTIVVTILIGLWFAFGNGF